jgi:hypothetical protein
LTSDLIRHFIQGRLLHHPRRLDLRLPMRRRERTDRRSRYLPRRAGEDKLDRFKDSSLTDGTLIFLNVNFFYNQAAIYSLETYVVIIK